MANEIQIVWKSDSEKVIADQAKYIASLEKTNKQLSQMGKFGAAAGQQVESGMKGIAAAMAKIGKSSSDPGRDAAAKLAALKAAALAEQATAKKSADEMKAVRQKARDAEEADRQLRLQQAGALIKKLDGDHDKEVADQKRNDAELEAVRKKARESEETDRQLRFQQAGALLKKLNAQHEKEAEDQKKHDAELEALRKKARESEEADRQLRLQQAGTLLKKLEDDRKKELESLRKQAADARQIQNQRRQSENEASLDRQSQARRMIAQLDAERRAAWLNSDMLNRAFVPSQRKAAISTGALNRELVGLAAGYMSVRTAINFVTTANREQMQQAEQARAKQEAQMVRFRAQGSLDVLKGREAQLSIMKSALRTSSTTEEASDAAASMVSTGFSTKEAQGPSLIPFLQTMKANAIDPRKTVSNTEMAESFSQFLNANKKELNAQNVQRLGVMVQGLKDTPMKVTDLQHLARESSLLREIGGVSDEEQLAIFGQLRRVEEPERASTHMREMVRQLATAGGSPKVVEQLGALGMSADDVNPKTHGLQNVLEKLNAAISKLPTETERATAWDTLIEGRNISSAISTTQSSAEIRDLRRKMSGQQAEQQFAADVGMTTTGQNAEIRRQKVKQEMFQAARDTGSELDREKFQTVIESKNMPDVVRYGANKLYDLFDSFYGHSTHRMLGGVLGGDNATVVDQGLRDLKAEELKADVQRTIAEEEAARKGGQRFQQVPNIQVQAPNVNVNVGVNVGGNGAKAPPVPAAALADVDDWGEDADMMGPDF